MVGSDGIIVADSRSVSATNNYTVTFHDGKTYPISKTDTESGLVFMKIGKAQNEQYTFYPVSLGDAGKLKLGQSVIAIGGKQSNSVSVGRVSQVTSSGADGSVRLISTDISKNRSLFGSSLVNLNGEVVGLEAPMEEGDSSLSYIPASTLKSSLELAIKVLSQN